MYSKTIRCGKIAQLESNNTTRHIRTRPHYTRISDPIKVPGPVQVSNSPLSTINIYAINSLGASFEQAASCFPYLFVYLIPSFLIFYLRITLFIVPIPRSVAFLASVRALSVRSSLTLFGCFILFLYLLPPSIHFLSPAHCLIVSLHYHTFLLAKGSLHHCFLIH